MPTNIFRKSSNSYKRVISGALIGLIFLTAIFFSRTLFVVLMMIISGVMLMEWYSITHTKSKYLYSGLLIIPVPISSLLYISSIDVTGWVLLTFFSIIWSVDIVAMYVGKAIKGPKLAPVLSPGKTISGFCGGVLAASILPIIFSFIPFYNMTIYSGVSKPILMIQFALIAILAQMSDLFISYFKRKFKVKDSGDIIPGHGGMLDRFDSIVFTAPIVALYLHSQI